MPNKSHPKKTMQKLLSWFDVQLGHANPSGLGMPLIAIVNKMTIEIDNPLLEDKIKRLKKAYCDSDLNRLLIEETDYYNFNRFNNNYTSIPTVNGWREAMARLQDTSIKQVAQKWASNV